MESRANIDIDPEGAAAYNNLANEYLSLNRLDDSQSVLDAAKARKLDYSGLHEALYALAFLREDQEGMQREATWAIGKPEEGFMLMLQADTEAFHGRMQKARQLWQRGADAAIRNDNKETAATVKLDEAMFETAFGDISRARRLTKEALALTSGREASVAAAQALTETGDSKAAEKLVNELNRDFPTDTIIQGSYLPAIRSQIELRRGNANKAISLLEQTKPLELGIGLYPAYVRGVAFWRAQQADAAAAEFQKILSHQGMILNSRTGPLARLGLARANALQTRNAQGAGAAARARAAYRDFLTLWKDADSDILILKAAKAEYAKLQ